MASIEPKRYRTVKKSVQDLFDICARIKYESYTLDMTSARARALPLRQVLTGGGGGGEGGGERGEARGDDDVIMWFSFDVQYPLSQPYAVCVSCRACVRRRAHMTESQRREMSSRE